MDKNQYMREWREKNREHLREYWRAYGRKRREDPEYREKARAWNRNYQQKKKEKENAGKEIQGG